MKTAQCKYVQADADITLILYFDPKAFDFIFPALTTAQEEEFISLICDSLAAALPREKSEKIFYIKRIFKPDNQTLKLLCTDGFLTDASLTIPISQQAYAKERIKIDATEQFPARLKLNQAVLKNLNDKLVQFENEARTASAFAKTSTPREAVRQVQSQIPVREFKTDKAFDVITEMSHAKKEIKDLSDYQLGMLQALLSGKNEQYEKDPVAKEIRSNLQNVTPEKFKEIITTKINEIEPLYENFSAEVEVIASQIANQTNKLMSFKQHIIRALYDSAKKFHALILQKFQNAPLHAKKALVIDFNKKFAGIASMNEAGELSSLQEAQKNLESLSLESLQEIISNDQKDHPGLLQRCNTSFTEESIELQIVMQNLNEMSKSLTALFKDDPQFANKQWIQITRIPVPRSFQFKFSDEALRYRKSVDTFCKTQKDIVMNLANQYKKILQVSDIHDKSERPTPALESKSEGTQDLQKYKEVSDTLINLAGKDHQITEKYQKTAEKLYVFMSSHVDTNLKSLLTKINSLIEKARVEVENTNVLMKQLVESKSQLDITISHYVLHPTEHVDFNELDKKIKSMSDKRSLLLAKNRVLQETCHRLETYDQLIRRIGEIDLSVTKNNVSTQRHQAKQFLLQFMQKQHQDPASSAPLKSKILDQYTKVDSSAADIDKIMTELSDIKNAIFDELGNEPEPSIDNLEMQFKTINTKMESLASVVNVMNQNITSLQELSQSDGKK